MHIRLCDTLIGFAGSDGGRAARIPEQEFKAACYAAAQAVGGAVTDFRAPDVTPNFYVAHIDAGGRETAVLGHCAEPYVAFAQPIDPATNAATFVDHEALADAFRQTSRFSPLTVATLSRALGSDDLDDLSAAVSKQLRYWKPESLGKAMFNWFD